MRVFISFSGKDRDIKDRIFKALKEGAENEIEIWESDDRCTSDYSSECIEAIDRSQIFIILISANSMSSESYCLNELIEARKQEGLQQLNILIYNIDGSPLTKRFRFHLNHISEANRVARLASDEDSGIASLVLRVNRLVQLRLDGTPELYIPEFNAIKPCAGSYFVEGSRDLIFDEIDLAFARKNVIFLEQIFGFGRKSAARKYAEINASSYDAIYYFPYFRGSIREFLLNCLNDKSAADSQIEICSEEERLMITGNMLSGLSKKTLLIVPEIVSNQKDDEFIYDILSSCGCRIIFITQSVPRRLRDRFPCVSVDRMEDPYLYRLFFHYYDRADEKEAEDLQASLHDFFDSIGGHTKTIELTAAILGDEFVFPEQVPELLRQISASGSEGLAGSIADSIANLFGIQEFDETEQQILWLASVLAYTPVDEKEFIEALRNANCFNANTLKKLIDRRWLDEDRSAGSISINEALSGVILSKIKPKVLTVQVCCQEIIEYLSSAGLSVNFRLAYGLFHICSKMFAALGYTNTARAAAIIYLLATDNKVNPVEIEPLIKSLQRDAIGSEYDEAVNTLIHLIQDQLQIMHATFSVSVSQPGDFIVRLVKASVGKLNEAFTELIAIILDEEDSDDESNGSDRFSMLTQMKMLIEQIVRDPVSSIPMLLSYTDALIKASNSYDETDPDDIIYYVKNMLSPLFFVLLPLFADEPYLGLKFCEMRRNFAEKIGGYLSDNECYVFNIKALIFRINLNIADEQTHVCYETAKKLLPMASAAVPSSEDVYDEFSDTAEDYIRLLVKRDKAETAEAVLYDLYALKCKTSVSVRHTVSAAQTLALYYIGAGKKKHAARILIDTIKYYNKTPILTDSKIELIDETYENVLFMFDILNVLDSPPPVESSEESAEYQNYYTANPVKTDKKAYALFEKIADQAIRTDYASLDAAGLVAQKKALENRAKAGEKPEALAAEAFALADEAGYRILGYRHRRVQFIGAAAMIGGNVAEIQNGEGKTYTLPLVAFLYALYGYQVHVIDSSDYLCKRNFGWMRGIYEALGCTVGMITDMHLVDEVCRCDILYTTIDSECFISLLADLNPATVHRHIRHDVLIADEADKLIDEAKQQYSQTSSSVETYDSFGICLLAKRAVDAADLHADVISYYSIDDSAVSIGAGIYEMIGKISGKAYDTFSQKDKNELHNALISYIFVKHIYQINKDYFIVRIGRDQQPRAMHEDLHTGNLIPFNRYTELFILIKEGVPAHKAAKVLKAHIRFDIITPWSVVRSFKITCGATATAASVSDLFNEYYGMNTYRIPTAKPVLRVEHAPRLYFKLEDKYDAIVNLIKRKAQTGQPVLAVCESTDESIKLHTMLKNIGIKATLLNVVNSEDRPELLANAGRLGAITVTTALANRGVDICLGGNPRQEAKNALIKEGVDADMLNAAIYSDINTDAKLTALRNQYNLLSAAWSVKLSQERKKLEMIGGLCVIGTTCFTDQRTEQQMIGRCGRQGSQGESYVFYCIQDPSFMNLFRDKVEAIKLYFDDDYIEVGVGPGGKFLAKSMSSFRKKRMQNDLSGADRSFDALMLAPLRRRFRLPSATACKQDADPKETLRFLIGSTSIFEESIRSLSRGRKTAKSEFVSNLAGLGFDLSFSPRQTPEKLSQYALMILENNHKAKTSLVPDVLRRILITEYNNAWKKYVDTAEIEYYGSQKRKDCEAYLARYVKEFGEYLYSKTADKALVRVISAVLHIVE